MASGSKNGLGLKYMGTLYSVGVTAGLSDGQLLDRFLAGRDGIDEVAFAALMERHGPMVFQVCRRILGNSHDAQDAFQATFFVLIRKAESIRRCESVGSWLFGVARRVAMRANADAARRQTHELQAAEKKATASRDEGDQAESWAALHEQIDRMPEKYRKPIVLCYLEGLTTEAAAQVLGCPRGTILSRLARARERLHAGLACRSSSLPAVLLAELMQSGTAKESTLAALFERTVRASLRFVEQPAMATNSSSATAVVLANGVLRAMTMTKLRIYGATVFASAILTGGAYTLGRQLDNSKGTPSQTAAQSGTEKRQPVAARPVEGRKAALNKRVYTGGRFNEDTGLEEGVKRFNEWTKSLGVGLNEPPLTTDEVVAAIRGWDPKHDPVEPAMLKSFQQAAETGMLPAGSSLSFTTRWSGYNGYAFDVWWVDLNMPVIANDEEPPGQTRTIGYTYLIRARILHSRPLIEQQEIERRERGLKRLERLKLEKKSASLKEQ